MSSGQVAKMTMRRVSPLGLVLAFTVAAATPAFARGWHGPEPEDLTYAGRCGLFQLSPRPEQRVFYRYDLRKWRYGDERDFSCFILENK